MNPVAPIWRETVRGVRLRVRVQPRSSRNRVAGIQGKALKVQVNAPPAGGAANRAVIDVLAAWLGVPRGAVELIQGQTGRGKLVEIMADDPRALGRRLQAALTEFVDKPAAGD